MNEFEKKVIIRYNKKFSKIKVLNTIAFKKVFSVASSTMRKQIQI